jgi:hypothetical protein
MKLLSIIALLVAPLFLLSCANKPAGDGNVINKANVFTYNAISAQGSIPGKVYIFPPLRSNKKGVPIEKLSPVKDAEGNVSDWKASSETSNRLHSKLRTQLSANGYDIIAFSDLVRVQDPYSVLVLSSFYSPPAPTETKEGEQAYKACLVMLKGSLFDLELNPATKKDVIQHDGLMKYPAENEMTDPIGKSLSVLFGKVGDNEEGYIYLE